LTKPFLILKNGLTNVSLQKVMSEPALRVGLQRENAPLGGAYFSWSGIVNNIRTYFQVTTDRFYIPSLSFEAAKIKV
jgi:hypothetical protein